MGIQKKIDMTELLKKIDNNYLQLTLNLALPKQKEIIEMKHGLKDGYCYSFNKIAEMRNMTRQAVRQTYWRGIERIKNILAA